MYGWKFFVLDSQDFNSKLLATLKPLTKMKAHPSFDQTTEAIKLTSEPCFGGSVAT